MRHRRSNHGGHRRRRPRPYRWSLRRRPVRRRPPTAGHGHQQPACHNPDSASSRPCRRRRGRRPSGLHWRSGYKAPDCPDRRSGPTASRRSRSLTAVLAPSQAKTWGASGSASTLVVYDTTGTWGWLGELYAMAGGQPGQPLRPGDRRAGGQLRGRAGQQLHGHHLHRALPTTSRSRPPSSTTCCPPRTR